MTKNIHRARTPLGEGRGNRAGPKESDVVIMLMGETGVGKSTFLNSIIGRRMASVGHGLEPHTKNIDDIMVPYPGDPDRRIVVVDTPGLNSSTTDDTGILASIILWLRKSYDSNKTPAIIYLYDITHVRIHIPHELFNAFKELCGDNWMGNIVIVTTKWDLGQAAEDEQREKALAKIFREKMGYHEPRMHRFDLSKSSAWRVVDSLLDKPKILILGQSGAGKSTFINTAIGSDVAVVGHDMESCTREIREFFGIHPITGRRVILVDTPGFNDTWGDDTKILRVIVDWLDSIKNSGEKFAGIIYLHEITLAREVSCHSQGLMSPTKLCHPAAVRNVILATVKWSQVKPDLGLTREEKLRDIWRNMVSHGSRMVRFQDTKESAWRMIDLLFQTEQINARVVHQEFDSILGTVAQKKRTGLAGGFYSFLFGSRRK